MRVSREFSKYAKEYGNYNIIQKKVAKKLISHLETYPKNILDLGCGEGAIYKQIRWKYSSFVGVDFAPNMLLLHPKANNIELIHGDFNQQELFDRLEKKEFDYIFSASALQWADDLEQVMKNIKELNAPVALAIFSSNTFKTLHKTAKLDGVLRTKEEIVDITKSYFDIDVEVIEYRVEFQTVRDMFRYIKKSGVSGSRNILNYKQTKDLMQSYPLNYLEFEVVFLTSL